MILNGYTEQCNENDFLEHKSTWFLRDLKNSRYNYIGMSIKRYKGGVIQKPQWFWKIFKDMSQFFVRNNPSQAFHLFCVKQIHQP